MLDKKGGGGKIGYQKILEKVIHTKDNQKIFWYPILVPTRAKTKDFEKILKIFLLKFEPSKTL